MTIFARANLFVFMQVIVLGYGEVFQGRTCSWMRKTSGLKENKLRS